MPPTGGVHHKKKAYDPCTPAPLAGADRYHAGCPARRRIPYAPTPCRRSCRPGKAILKLSAARRTCPDHTTTIRRHCRCSIGGIHMKWENINLQFGNVLRKIREGRCMTQEEFSAFCGISRAYYGRVERGEHSATLEICQKISEATGLSFSELFEDIV